MRIAVVLTILCSNPLSSGCKPKDEPWETIESYGRCKLRTRGKDRRGDILGRGKHYDPGVKSLWHSGNLVVDHIRDFQWTRDDRWAIVTTRKDPKDPIGEVLLVDLQTGAIQRTYALPGTLMATCMDSPVLRVAFGVQDRADKGRSHVVTLDTTQSEFTLQNVYSGPGNVIAFPQFSWSPDSTQLAFDVIHWRRGGTRFSFVHIHLIPEPKVVSTRETGGQYVVDWSDPENPR